MAYVGLGLLIMGGAVLVGFEVRDARLSGQIESAAAEAERIAVKDTYTGYLVAVDTAARITAADDSPAHRAGRALVAARMAAEMGEGLDQARRLISEMGQESDLPDALAARGFLALAEEDAERASASGAALRQRAPEHPDALYLAGRAALLAGRAPDAAQLLSGALQKRPRPAAAVALARAQAKLGHFPEARAALDRAVKLQPGHPAAVIWGARIAVASRTLPPGPGEPEASLEAVIQQASVPAADQAVGVSPGQGAWAALALGEVKLARGDRTGALNAVTTAQSAQTRGGFAFRSALADILVELGEMTAARAQVDLVIKEWPKAVASRALEARVAMASGDPGSAVAALDKAGDLGRYPEAMALRGRARLATGAIEQAAADLDAALALRPDQQGAILARAEVDLARGDARMARRRLAQLYGDGRAAPVEVIAAYAASLRQSGDRGEARKVLAVFSETRSVDAGDWRILIEQARLARAEGSWKEAADQYGKAIAAAPRALDTRLEAASLALDIGQLASARAQLDALVGEAAQSGLVLVEAARVRILSGDHTGAGELLDRAGRMPSPGGNVARERGRLLVRQRRPDLAVVELQRAKATAPRDGENRLLLMEAYLLGKNRRSAARELVELTKSFRRTSLLALSRGLEALGRERWRDAASEAARAHQVALTNGEPPRVLGRAAYWTGRALYLDDKRKRAIEWLERAVAHDPSLADAHYLLGQIAFEAGNQAAMVKRFQKAVGIDPVGNPQAWYFLGEHYLTQGRKDQAREALQTYLERWPESDFSADARELLSKIR